MRMHVAIVLALVAAVSSFPEERFFTSSRTMPAQQQLQQQEQLMSDEPLSMTRGRQGGPQRSVPVIPVLRRTEIHDESGQYALGFESGNGIVVSEQGALKKNVDGEWKDDVVLVKRGSYRYPAPDGRIIQLSYTADENGFHPTGEHLPVTRF